MTPALVITLFVGVFVSALTLAIRLARKQAEQGRQIRQYLGFSPVEPVDPALVERIATILQPRDGRLRVSKVYRRELGACTLYDCRILQGRNSDSSDQSSVLVGRGWQFPSLRIAPRLGGEGRGWNLLQRLTLLAIRQGGFEQVALDDQPELARKYLVLSRRPQEVVPTIPRDFWRALAAFPEQLLIQAEGDTVMFSTFAALRVSTSGGFEAIETDRLKRIIETASRLDNLFDACRQGTIRETAWR